LFGVAENLSQDKNRGGECDATAGRPALRLVELLRTFLIHPWFAHSKTTMARKIAFE
jgi:hypothetical protein